MLIESPAEESEAQFRAFLLATLTGIYGRLPEWLEFQIGHRFQFQGRLFRQFICPAGSVSAHIYQQATRAEGIARAIIERGVRQAQPFCFEISAGVETQINCDEIALLPTTDTKKL